MKTQVRPPANIAALLRDLLESRRKEIEVDPESGFFGVKDLAGALKRAGNGDIILLPPGDYSAIELKKNVEVRALQPGSVTIKGTLRVSTAQTLLRGLNLRSDSSEPALISEKGILVLDDCNVHGRIEAGSPAGKSQLFLRNCRIGHANDAVLLTNQAELEIMASRISDCRIGVALRQGCSCAIYHTRIQHCVNNDENDPGAAVFGEKSAIYCEGVRFEANGVGTYLRDCDSTDLLASHFQACGVASLITTGTTSSKVHLRSSLVENQTSGDCPQLFITGGILELAHVDVKLAPAPALSADQAQMELKGDSFASKDNPAIDLRSCQLTGHNLKCLSTNAAGLAASQCSGTFRESIFSGTPPISVIESPSLVFESCDSDVTADALFAEPDEENPLTIEGILDRVRKSIGQDAARHELERLLRLAHATRQRELDGLPPTEQNYHSVFMGGHGTGRLEAAQRLAEGLHALGIIAIPQVREILALNPQEVDSDPAETGVIFIRIRQALTSVVPAEAVALMERLASKPGHVVILAGERDEVRRLLRSSMVLDRLFRRTLFFSTYGPAELATVFAQYCERDHIRIGHEAAEAILLVFHLYSERKDKRFANTAGVKAMYENTRHRYLERSSQSNRSDLDLAVSDLDIPADRSVRNALERCPAFVTFCPSCRGENPWLPALAGEFVCLHCDTLYSATWGIWRDSTTYRRITENFSQSADSPISARKIHLPTR